MGLFGGGKLLRGRTLNWAVTGKFQFCTVTGHLRINSSLSGKLSRLHTLLGHDQGVMSGLIGASNQFAQQFNHPNAKLQGIITSIYDIGYAAGALFNFFSGKKLGRKNMIIAGGTTMIIGTTLLALLLPTPRRANRHRSRERFQQFNYPHVPIRDVQTRQQRHPPQHARNNHHRRALHCLLA